MLQKPSIVISVCTVQHIPYCTYRNCLYKRLPEDEPWASKHVEDIKI